MNIRAIRTEADYDWALAEIEPYFETEPAQGSAAAERFDILADLIGAYEAKRWPIQAVDPVEVIRFRMDAGDLGQADLARVIGSRSRASEVLSRKRPLTLQMIQRLHEEWRIPADLLIAPYHLRDAG